MGWDKHHVIQPSVVRLRPDLWYMWFGSYGRKPQNQQTGLAISNDGVHWRKYEGNPIISWGEPGSWDCRKASSPVWLYLGGDKFRIYYSGDNGISYLGIGFAKG